VALSSHQPLIASDPPKNKLVRNQPCVSTSNPCQPKSLIVISLKQQAPPYSELTNQSANAQYYVPNTLCQSAEHQPSVSINQTDAHQNQFPRKI
jgi:hypothetical protein